MSGEKAKASPPSQAPKPSTRGARVAGHIGLWLSVAVLVVCIILLFSGVRRAAGVPDPSRVAPGALVLQGLLFGLVAALGIWLFYDFVKLPDWTLAPEVPQGLKVFGHLGRVLGSLAAAACIALAVMAAVFPDHAPPVRRRPAPSRSPDEALAALKKKPQEAKKAEAEGQEEAEAAPDLGKPRPGLAFLYVLGIFVALAVRLFGSAIAEQRTWARVGSLVASGAALTVLLVALVLSLTRGGSAGAHVALALLTGGALALFVFLLVYFMVPEVVAAFESRRL